MSWTNTGGGDHDGEDWTPTNTLTIAGIHYNIGTFTITNGYTVNILATTDLNVYATTIAVTGTLNGNGRGYDGGTLSNDGSGTGGGDGNASWSAGGGGYGGHGGQATAGGIGGVSYGISDTAFIQQGSGGGGAGSGREGGNGGGCIGIYGKTITVSGTINCIGNNGNATADTGGGGGSGGGIFLCGGTVTIYGTLNSNGGSGGDGTGSDGGRGGGGRVKILYDTLDTSGSTITAVQGTFGGTGGVANGTTVNTLIGQCTATRAFGQTFQWLAQGVLSKISLYVNTVNTSGDFTLKVWDDAVKSNELATKTITISGTGLTDFEFAIWEPMIASTTYYFELNPDTTGDIELGVYGLTSISTGDYYEDGFIVSYFDTYFKLTGLSHVVSSVVYNTADTAVKSNMTNEMLIGAVHHINSDNTGTVTYSDNFTTAKYLGDYTALSGITHDAGNDELDIADGGYINYLIDTKYPITGIPTLTSQINITSGAPTIQISSNGSTWYDIDTAIVDDVSIKYELDNTTDLQFDGLTSLYFRVDCTAAGTLTCSIKTLALSVNIVTIDAENPIISTGAINTFKLDQDTTSGINCIVDLMYRDRSWA